MNIEYLQFRKSNIRFIDHKTVAVLAFSLKPKITSVLLRPLCLAKTPNFLVPSDTYKKISRKNLTIDGSNEHRMSIGSNEQSIECTLEIIINELCDIRIGYHVIKQSA